MPSKVLSGTYVPCKGDIYYSSMRDEFVIMLSPSYAGPVHKYFNCLSLKTQKKLVADLSMSKKMGWHIWLSVKEGENPLD